jgi:hypothetical protein
LGLISCVTSSLTFISILKPFLTPLNFCPVLSQNTKWLSHFVFSHSNSHYKNRFFESPLTAGFQKTDFVVSSAEGTGNNKISFIMRIAVFCSNYRSNEPQDKF